MLLGFMDFSIGSIGFQVRLGERKAVRFHGLINPDERISINGFRVRLVHLIKSNVDGAHCGLSVHGILQYCYEMTMFV
jgi:hypothetical protein